MRVLHVTTEYPPIIHGGLGTAVGGLVAASARAGLNVAVLLVGDGTHSAYASIPADDGRSHARSKQVSARILVHAIPHAGAADEAIRFARQWKPDVVHVHVFWLAHVAMAVRTATGTPVVYTVHSLDRAEYEIGDGPPECLTQWNTQSALIDAADRVVALTADERGLITRYCRTARARVRVVGNGIADSPAARRALLRDHPDPVTILYSGRFVDRKGIRELLDAAPHVLEAHPGVRFVLAGGHRHCSGADMARHWLTSSGHAWGDRIVFTGWLDQEALSRWYACADVLVVPSWYEPFGMVVLEGMLYGLPIVACNVGGPRAILRHGATGLLCEPRDSAALADALLRIVTDRPLRARLGRNAARQVRKRWLHERVVPRMAAVYREVVQEQH